MMVSGLFFYFGFRFCQRLTHDAESRQLIDLYLESHSSESQTHDAEWSLQLEGWIVMSDTFWLKCPSIWITPIQSYLFPLPAQSDTSQDLYPHR